MSYPPLTLVCPACQKPLPETANFCSNCGFLIKKPPLSTSLSAQLFLYLKSLILFPLGLVWGGRYLRQPGGKAKAIGLFTILITVIELIFIVATTIRVVNTVNRQINLQLQSIGSY